MGQAKQRGAKEDRVATALGLKKHNIDDVKKLFNLPDEAQFLGYLVHVKNKDEFLHSITDTTHTVERKFTGTPEKAFRFDAFIDAHEAARKEKGEIVVTLFDIGAQLAIFEV